MAFKKSKTINGTSLEGEGNIEVGGGVSGLTQKQVLYGKSDGTIDQDSAFIYDEITKSLYIREADIIVGDTVVFFGDSIVGGVGATSTPKRWTSLVSTIFGWTEDNDGLSNSTLQKRSPIDYNGATNMVDRIPDIPTKTGSHKYIVFSYGINDFRYAGGDYSAANFLTDYTTVINGAIAKGWAAENIVISSLPWVSPSSYATLATFGTPDQALMDAYNAATVTLSTTFGTRYIDFYTAMANNGGVYLLNDGLHPNDAGYAVMSLAAANTMRDDIDQDGQTLAVNGITELQTLTYKNFDLVGEDGTYMLGINPSTGKIGVILNLPDGIRVNGDLSVLERIIQTGAIVPTGSNDNDWIVKEASAISSASNSSGNSYGKLELFSSLGTVLRNSHSSGFIALYISGGTTGNQVEALRITGTGVFVMPITPPVSSTAYDILVRKTSNGVIETISSDVKADKLVSFNEQTGSYTLVLTDNGKQVIMNVAGANNLTIPPNSSVAFPVGTQILVEQTGAGQTTIVAGSGVTIQSSGGRLKTSGQYSVATLIKKATDTWLLAGDIAV